MVVLGLSPFGHDSAAALLQDGQVTAAIEDRKLTRRNVRGVPEAAIRSCLQQAGVAAGELDEIVIASRPLPASLRRWWFQARSWPLSPLAAAYSSGKEIGLLAGELSDIRDFRQQYPSATVRQFDHHLCHASAAFYQSPFERALVITLDGEGDGSGGLIALGQGSGLQILRRLAYPGALAWAYAQVTELIGFRARQDEHKTQWLALEGTPVYKGAFLEMLRPGGGALPAIAAKFVSRGPSGQPVFSPAVYRLLGVSQDPNSMTDEVRRGLAASMQQACTELVADMIRSYLRSTATERICLAGGMMNNSLLVSDLEEIFGLDNIYVPPAPGNAGSAIGAALLSWHQKPQRPRTTIRSMYLGPDFTHHEIKEVLDNSKCRYTLQNTEARKLEATVQLLSAGKIVGWYQGAAEFGPRALAHRSILASPWASYVQDNLNDFIKHREWFRPFAVAVPEEHCERYFVASQLCRFMNSLARIKPENNPLPASFCLPGGRVRLHIVERRSNPMFWSLLNLFGDYAPAPIILNTSFNLFGEPLVLTPRDGLRSYFCSGLDALVIGNFALSKTGRYDLPVGSPSVRQERADA